MPRPPRLVMFRGIGIGLPFPYITAICKVDIFVLQFVNLTHLYCNLYFKLDLFCNPAPVSGEAQRHWIVGGVDRLHHILIFPIKMTLSSQKDQKLGGVHVTFH